MTERAKKLLLLYCKQGGKIRRVSGLPLLTFKAKKAGTLKNYRIYGNTETKTRSYSGSAPLSFPIVDGAVSNYRVYGNTVNGESVGDRTENILPMSTTPIDTIIDDFHCEYDGMGTIILTATKDNADFSSFTIPLKEDFIIPISVGQGGNGCVQLNNDKVYTINSVENTDFMVCFNFNNIQIDYFRLLEVNRIHSNYISMGGKTINNISINKTERFVPHLAKGDKLTIRPAFYNNGTTEQVPFEPYGYRIPITNNSETANIYLDEPLRMVGDEAEYVDFEEQKQHRVRKNLLENTATSQTINGVTFTVNSDGSVTCNGKCVNNVAVLYIKRPTTFYDETIQYTLTGCPVGGAYNSTYALEYTNSIDQSKPDVGNGVSFTPYRKEIYPYACIRIVIFVGYTCDNLTFYPMIRKADIEDDTYEPYIENTEVDVTLPALPAQSSTNSLSVGTVVQPSSVAVDVDEVVSCGDRIENLFDGTFIHRSVIMNTVGDDNPNRRSIVVDISNFNNGDKITFSRETSAGNIFQMYQVSSPLKGGILFGDNVISGNSNTLLATITLDNISNYHYLMIFLNGATNTITDEELLASKIIVNVGNTPLPYEVYGYKVPVTVEGKNLFDYSTVTTGYRIIWATGQPAPDATATISDYIAVNSGTYAVNSRVFVACYDSSKNYLGVYSTNGYAKDYSPSVDYIVLNSACSYIRIFSYNVSGGDSNTISQTTMLNAGSTPLPYEPYHAPVTTTIYLPEQIKKVGDEAEYIDYGEQKQHRVRKNYFQSSDFEAGAIYTGQGWGNITYQDSKTPSGMQDTGQVVFYTTRKRSTDLITIIGTYTISIADGWEFGIVMFPNDRNSGELFIYNTEPVTISNCTFAIQFRKTDVSDISSADISDYKIMLNKGSTPLPYEPYIENTEVDVTLPALPTLTGTNVLTVGTEVQPSSVEIKGRIKAAGGD